MSTETVISGLKKIKKNNANSFHIFYGGEPLLRKDLFEIINYCNDNQIYYTIITNNTEEIQPLMKNLFKKVSYIEGISGSIDPIIYQDKNNDIFKKSFEGLKKLTEYTGFIKDVVAEITVTNENLEYLYLLVRDLTDRGISSSITFIDITKSKYYDFSDVEDESILVRKSQLVRDTFNRIIDEKLNVHMRDTLLPRIYNALPSEFNCNIEEDFHNMCVDSDGSIRLCLRVRGVATPENFNLSNVLDDNGNLNEYLKQMISFDKKNYCTNCNHTCYMMSEISSKNENEYNNLIHSEIRGK
jgi:MoaA/NifB/PqqE/SkfB family radical SAM enzyme